MDKYYRLLPDYKALCVDIELRDCTEGEINDDMNMKRGVPIAVPLDSPMVFDFEVDEYDLNHDGTWKMPSYNTEGPTMDVELIKTIQDVGVDNLDIYPAIFVNSETGEKFHDWHVAVNVIGLVSCADMDASHAQPLADTHFFYELKIDLTETMGLLMFRLAEQPSDIIVHEKVAEAIRRGAFEGLILEEISKVT